MFEENTTDCMDVTDIATEIATRTNADPAELKPRLAAALVVAAIHTAVQYWLDNPTVGTLRDALTASMQGFHLPEIPATKPT